MNNVKEQSIRRRLIMSYIQISVIVGAAALVGIICLFVMSGQYDHAMKYYGFSQGDIGKAMTAFTDTRSALRGAIGYDGQEEIDKMIEAYNTKKAEFDTYMQAVKASMVTDEGHAAYAAIVDAVEGYWIISDSIIEQGATTDTAVRAQAQKRAFEELAPAYDKVYGALTDLMDVNVVKGDETQVLMQILKFALAAVIFIIVSVAVVVAIRIGRNISNGIEGPLEALGERLEKFSHGDLGSPFPETEKQDEIAAIIDDCRRMAENLNAIISDAGNLLGEMAGGNFMVRTAVEEKYEGDFNPLLMSMLELNHQLDTTLKHINDASAQVTEGAGQLAESAQELADGATEQAGAIQELTATVENVTGISEESAENAIKAANRARESVETADKSREDMNELILAMERITETSKEIEKIIAAIEDIASQTNLLSLNASIEAARAGEAGRGFAVVADQIGKLANDSAQSAISTKNLINKSLEEIERGNQMLETTMKAINTVLAAMEEFAGVATGAAEASKIQADMLKQVEDGIEQISTVVQSNSAASEETSAISEELSAQAISLKEMVSYFKLRND